MVYRATPFVTLKSSNHAPPDAIPTLEGVELGDIMKALLFIDQFLVLVLVPSETPSWKIRTVLPDLVNAI